MPGPHGQDWSDDDLSHDSNSSTSDNPGGDKEWIPDEALEALKMERSVRPTLAETNEELAHQLFDEALPSAVLAITHLAIHSPNERMRLDAAKYVTERVLGRTTDQGDSSGKNGFEKVIGSFVREVEEYTASTSSTD